MNGIKIIIIIFSSLIFFYAPLVSKEIIWADKVVAFSTEKELKRYASIQALGEPSVTSNYGVSPVAWMPVYDFENYDFIHLGFTRPFDTRQIIINQNFIPDAIEEILLYNNKGDEISRITSERLKTGTNLLLINLDRSYTISSLRIIIKVEIDADMYQIDAVGLSSDTSDYTVTINQADESLFKSQANKLPNTINTDFEEIAPIISANGKILYFVRDRYPENISSSLRQDIWYSELDSLGNFKKAVNIGPPLNNSSANFVLSTNTDGSEIYLGGEYDENSDNTKSGISFSKKNDTSWTFPTPIIIHDLVNNNRFVSYFITNDKEHLLISMENDKSHGGLDLYISNRLNENEYSTPINLGKSINTASDEITPFLSPDNRTLYFSTGGYPGYGKSDIFMSQRLGDSWEIWSKPINLGQYVNSPTFDAYFSIAAKGDKAYFSSSINSNTGLDIYSIELPKSLKPETVILVKGKTLNKKDSSQIFARIFIENLKTGERVYEILSSSLTGEFELILPGGSEYGLRAEKSNFLSVNQNIDLSSEIKYEEIEMNLYLVPIEKGQNFVFNNIFFDFNDFKLLEKSKPELERLYNTMSSNKSLKILISGHTDDVGSDEFNYDLSIKRASSVKSYLIDKGISDDRISIKGHGSKKPLAIGQDDKSRKMNRRVELTILEN